MIAVMSARLSELFESAGALHLEPGAPLFHAGDGVGAMYLVRAGRVVLQRATRGGDHVVLQRAGPGAVPAEASAYSPHYHCAAVAESAAELAVMPLERFHDRLAEDAALAALWARHLAHAVQQARMRAEMRSLRGVADRLEMWLDWHGALPARGRWQALADDLGVTREALYRELARRRRAAG